MSRSARGPSATALPGLHGLHDGVASIVEAPEEGIAEAARLRFALANLKAEPTGALSAAVLLTQSQAFRDRAVCCVVSGGNIDPTIYRSILAG